MYLDIYGVFWLIVICSLAAFWYKNLSYKDLAYRSALSFCREADVQLLDQTIVLTSLRPGKHLQKWYLRRHYQFEFTTSGADRYKGHITLMGRSVIDIQLAAHRLH